MTFLKNSIAVGVLLFLPLIGLQLAGLPLSPYLEFPPRTIHVESTGFSWIAFIALGAFTLACIFPLLFQVFFGLPRPQPVEGEEIGSVGPQRQTENPPTSSRPFPWWGWMGLLLSAIAWVLAWNRFSWFAAFQPHTFTPLWLGYIFVVNALTHRRSGRCMLLDRPGIFFLLFANSAGFWWFFEYLNRFAGNWYYLGVQSFSPLEYFLHATICFSTVLPAVAGTFEWLQTFPFLQARLRHGPRWTVSVNRPVAIFILTVVLLAFLGIGVYPHFLFPLLWVGPPILVIVFQSLNGRRHLLSDLEEGDWRFVGSAMLAGLMCGFFWELWNFYSAAKWIYAVPYVHRFQIFEMPILGYAGYLPFGLLCVAVAKCLLPPTGCAAK